MHTKRLSLLLLLFLIIVDQVLKIYIKTTMTIGESNEIFSWFKIQFVENNGMAFGMELGSKYFLTGFRIIFSCVLFYFLFKLYKTNISKSYIYVITFVLAGALGNIIDCLFYGLIFSESTITSIATFVPIGDGYSTFMLGKVVDMFYFPIFTLPVDFPILPGFHFFSYIFNLADSYITVSIIVIMLFFRKEFNSSIDMIFGK